MNENLQIPVCMCPNCASLVPVVIEEITPDEWHGISDPSFITSLIIVYCPQCSNILNLDGEIPVDYYTIEELAKLGWKLA